PSCPVPAAPKSHCCLFAYPNTGLDRPNLHWCQPPPFAHPAQSPARCELELAQPLHRRMIKWCPAPGCEYAVDFTVASGNLMSPASAHIAFVGIVLKKLIAMLTARLAKWILKNSAESENMDR
ncbi:hypothetical protein Godav_006863, partial [Gossypium davidsonii]|nr:hypothetical protein [Gossypium davidsonii]